MTIDKHDFVHDFPEHRETITKLKETDAHFLKLFDEYHDITHEVHNIETNNINVSDEHFETLKIKRSHLKDELYQMILKAS